MFGVAPMALSLLEGLVTALSWFMAWGMDNGEVSILGKWWNSGFQGERLEKPCGGIVASIV